MPVRTGERYLEKKEISLLNKETVYRKKANKIRYEINMKERNAVGVHAGNEKWR